MYLNGSVPYVRCFVRREFLYNLEEHSGEFDDCYIVGISSIKGRALGFHILMDDGAVFWRMPIHALAHRKDAPFLDISTLQMWDCFSYSFSVTQLEFLKSLQVSAFVHGLQPQKGAYLFTVDYCASDPSEINVTYAETADEHKCHHIIKLYNGCFAALPNNRILWQEPSFIVGEAQRPDYKTNTHIWSCETGEWTSEDSDRFFYRSTDEVEERAVSVDCRNRLVDASTNN